MSKTEDRAKRRALVETLAPPVVGTLRTVCPTCNGGSSGEETLVVSRLQSGEVSAHCFRATCKFTVGARHTEPLFKAKEPRYYTRPTSWVSDEHANLILARFGLEHGTVEAYSELDDRFVLPVINALNRRRGVVAYSLSGGVPKSLTYNERPEEPFMHWAEGCELEPVVIVEDWFSAEKVAAAGGVGVAIMGTYLSAEMVAEIAQFRAPVVLAFDYDAFSQALKYQAKYAEQFPEGLTVWRLKKDLKYEPIERIQRAFAGETDFHGDAGTIDHSGDARRQEGL